MYEPLLFQSKGRPTFSSTETATFYHPKTPQEGIPGFPGFIPASAGFPQTSYKQRDLQFLPSANSSCQPQRLPLTPKKAPPTPTVDGFRGTSGFIPGPNPQTTTTRLKPQPPKKIQVAVATKKKRKSKMAKARSVSLGSGNMVAKTCGKGPSDRLILSHSQVRRHPSARLHRGRVARDHRSPGDSFGVLGPPVERVE